MKLSIILSSYLITILTACCTPSKLEQALTLSRDNRPELEKVLHHYSAPADSLKLQAARFLIENMPGHYTLRGDKIDAYRQIIDQDTTCSYYYKKLYDITLDHFIQDDKNIRREEDVKYITADYLIRHIDASFELINKQGLLEIIPFDFFIEYILPYRFKHERLDLWRDSMQVTSFDIPLSTLKHDLEKLASNFTLNDPKNGGSSIFKLLNPFGDCYFITYNTMLAHRSLGIPSIIDCIPFYSNRNGYHYWCSEPPYLYKSFTIKGAFDRRTAKVYRNTFSRNPFLVPEEEEFIPEFFKDPFMQDVTDSYCYTTDIQIENNSSYSPRHAYLCVFNNLEWKPIAAGKVSNNKAKFSELAKNIAYLPVYYDSTGMYHPFNYPFILDTKGDTHYLIPSPQKHTLHLERKNPDLTNALHKYLNTLNGTIIEASNDKEFSRVDTVFVLEPSKKLFFKARNMHPDKKYQWYRIPQSGREKYIAELYFFNSRGEKLQAITDSLYHAAIDGNPLTNVSLYNTFLTLHFDTPVTIDELVCLPRNDGNGIYPGNLYKLLYHDRDGWQSLGIQEGCNFYLEYDNVPKNALYWLRNLTTGVEERIFTYENGVITFW
ncbi:hypothetical protein [uncultured Butyricimonas sp.]|uniref:hypothetical protein n=1 Tax=uncultured Butyricimonas sp. TaxID=1268785 RepID=UPI0026DD62DF|nr:hypothetical protein [uncultured Butyricimonas sp.]